MASPNKKIFFLLFGLIFIFGCGSDVDPGEIEGAPRSSESIYQQDLRLLQAKDFLFGDELSETTQISHFLVYGKSTEMAPNEIHIVSTHATATPLGDIQECTAIREVFADCPNTYINNTKGFIGHAMGAAGALELAGNLPSFEDKVVHPSINVDQLDPKCEMNNLVLSRSIEAKRVDAILNNSFGMLGINSVLIVRHFSD